MTRWAGGRLAGASLALVALALVALVLVALAIFVDASPARAQATGTDVRSSTIPARVAFALEPDTVRVGEPFILGITVRPEPGWRPSFPPVLPVGERFEQRAPAEVRQLGVGEWRAYYHLVAWETEPGSLPPVDLELTTDRELLSAALRPPAVTVSSVLPEAVAGLELRPARPFLARSGAPWLLLLLGLLSAAALLAWWWSRRRTGEAVGTAGTEGPLKRARRELEKLRRLVEAGELGGAPFYDRLEGSLRRYAEVTRSWAPGTLMQQLPDGNRELASVLRHSALARFGRLESGGETAARALDVSEAWLAAEASEEAGE